MASGRESPPGIPKLSPPVRITEVHLWDECVIDSYSAKGTKNQHIYFDSSDEMDEATLRNVGNTRTELSQNVTGGISGSARQQDEENMAMEDLELVHQMGALGLPISFSTSKEKNLGHTKKKKGRDTSGLRGNTFAGGGVADEFPDVERSENVFTTVLDEHYNSPEVVDIYEELSLEKNDESFSIINLDIDECVNNVCTANVQKNADCVSGSGHISAKCVCRGTSFLSEETLNCSSAVHMSGESLEHCQLEDIATVSGEVCREMAEEPSFENSATISGGEVCEEMAEESCENSGAGTAEPVSSLMVEPSKSALELATSGSQIENFNLGVANEYGSWEVIWDTFYQRYYFYNKQTHESTWYPPPGLEGYCHAHSAFGSKDGMHEAPGSSCESCDQPTEDNSSGANHVSVSVVEADQSMDIIDTEASEKIQFTGCVDLKEEAAMFENSHVISNNVHSDSMITPVLVPTFDEPVSGGKIQRESFSLERYGSSAKKRKKKIKRALAYTKTKYWNQRYSLFSRFDSGISMDEEGWYSVTPEVLAIHHASRCSSGTVIDCFAGVGGNAIQFAMKSKHVIAVDIDPQKVSYAQHNAAIYGIDDKIDFIVGDFLQIAPYLKGDTVFLSPPWGGPDYAKAEVYDITTMLKPCDGSSLFRIASAIAPQVVMYLPRNVDMEQLTELSLSLDRPWALEVEKNYLDGRLKAVTAYFEAQ